MSELNSEIRFNILVPLVVDMIQKREREKGNLVKQSTHVEYGKAINLILDAVIQALPKFNDMAEVSIHDKSGYARAMQEVTAILEAAKSGGTQ